MIAGSLARRYARALFDVGTSKGNYEQLGAEMDSFAKTYAGSRELAEALTNPIFSRAKRRAVLDAVLERTGASQVTRNFALLLFDRERIAYVPSIARELRNLVDDRAGRVRAWVTSASPLSTDQTKQIQGALEGISHKQVILSTKEDPELLGGVVAKIGDVVYDGSVRTQLDLLRERFLS